MRVDVWMRRWCWAGRATQACLIERRGRAARSMRGVIPCLLFPSRNPVNRLRLPKPPASQPPLLTPARYHYRAHTHPSSTSCPTPVFPTSADARHKRTTTTTTTQQRAPAAQSCPLHGPLNPPQRHLPAPASIAVVSRTRAHQSTTKRGTTTRALAAASVAFGVCEERPLPVGAAH